MQKPILTYIYGEAKLMSEHAQRSEHLFQLFPGPATGCMPIQSLFWWCIQVAVPLAIQCKMVESIYFDAMEHTPKVTRMEGPAGEAILQMQTH